MNLSSFGRRLLQAADAATGGTILGLGTAAYNNTGTSGANIPLLNAANTWSGNNVWSLGAQFNNVFGVGRPGLAGGGLYFNRDPDNPFILFSYGTTPGTTIGQVRASGASGIVGFTDPTGAVYGFSHNPTSQVSAVIGSFARGAPVTKTADFTVAATENWLINNKSGSTCTVTLPAASSFTGREIYIKTIQAQTVVSASSNVVPLAGGAASTAILAATAGKWALLVSDGTNWIIMAAA